MEPVFFARGFALGFTIAAAVGPISLLTIRRTLAHGRWYGLASGAGVALADATYAAIAAFGLTAVTSLLVGSRMVLELVGGVFVAILAVRTITSRPSAVAVVTERPGSLGAFVSIYGLTMTNPMTILSFAGLFAGLGFVGGGVADATLLVAGVLGGSMAVGRADQHRGRASREGHAARPDLGEPNLRRRAAGARRRRDRELAKRLRRASGELRTPQATDGPRRHVECRPPRVQQPPKAGAGGNRCQAGRRALQTPLKPAGLPNSTRPFTRE